MSILGLFPMLQLELVLLPVAEALSSLLTAKAMMEAAKPQPRCPEDLQWKVHPEVITHRRTGH